MKRIMMTVFLFSAACIFISGNAFAAWTQAKGHSYNQLTVSRYKTTSKMTTIYKDADDNVLTTHGKAFKNEEEEFSSNKLSYYGEYGLLDSLTVILSGGWDYVRSNDILRYTEDKDSVSGVGDIIVGLRQKISDNVAGGPMSVQLDVKIPEAYTYENPVDHQNLGDGQYDATLKLLVGHGFSKGYMVLGAGYKYRFENNQLDDNLSFKPSDQFTVGISGGYNATSWLSIRGQIDWNRAVGNAEVSDELVTYAACCGVKEERGKSVLILDTIGLEQSALSAGVALAFTITPKIQTVLSYNTDLQAGRVTENASLGQTFSIAFVYMQ